MCCPQVLPRWRFATPVQSFGRNCPGLWTVAGGSVKAAGLGDGATPGARIAPRAADKFPIAKLAFDAATRVPRCFHRHIWYLCAKVLPRQILLDGEPPTCGSLVLVLCLSSSAGCHAERSEASGLRRTSLPRVRRAMRWRSRRAGIRLAQDDKRQSTNRTSACSFSKVRSGFARGESLLSGQGESTANPRSRRPVPSGAFGEPDRHGSKGGRGSIDCFRSPG